MITVYLHPEDFISKKQISVAAKTISGKWIPGEVRWIVKPQYIPSRAITCKENKELHELEAFAQLSTDELELVVKTRILREKMLSENLKNLWTDNLVEKLKKLELELGLNYDAPLTLDLPLETLTMRVGKIRALAKAMR